MAIFYGGNMKKAQVYVDGSFSNLTDMAGSAVIMIISKNNKPLRIAYQKPYKTLKKYGSNIAEINAVKTAIKTAKSNGITDLTIYYDWEGLVYFSDRTKIKQRHKNCQCYIQYAEFVTKYQCEMNIHFQKVKAHSKVILNDAVDKMARAGAVV